MDPYLEQPNLWPSFHFRLIGAIAAVIEPQLSSQYYYDESRYALRLDYQPSEAERNDESLYLAVD